MRPNSVITTLISLFGITAVALAQPAPDAPAAAPDTPPAAEPAPDSTASPDAPATDTAAPEAAADGAPAEDAADAPPAADAPAGEPAADASEDTPAPVAVPDPTDVPDLSGVPSPGELDARLDREMPDTFDGADTWTAPTPVLTLHGYMRMRAELLDTFWLGRTDPTLLNRADILREPDPFTRFRPAERLFSQDQCGGLGEDTIMEGPAAAPRTYCDVSTVRQANIRLRLSPHISLNEDVRVKMSFDILDNAIAGSAPESFYGSGMENNGLVADSTLGSRITVRRAWAEVRNRDLGEIRFGRMPVHWGLGMLYNAGDEFDQDYSTNLDRMLIVSKVAGLYFGVGYDFPDEGVAGTGAGGGTRPRFDLAQADDVDQWTFSISRQLDDEDRTAQLERGGMVLEGGIQLRYRDQDAVYDGDGSTPLIAMSGYHLTPDVWGRVQWRDVTLGAEFVWVYGEMRRVGGEILDIDQMGAVVETEFRFQDGKLALYYDTGIATGDSEVEGLSSDANFAGEAGVNGTMSTFRFHPSYQVDMILWRNIMRQVTGAYYFRPGISYDFVRDEFGQLFGARLDIIWSRATAFIQTPGNDADLGVELNVKLYWNSDDGPDPTDGYHARLEYGVLFPMQGLGYYYEDTDLDLAQQLRLLLGVSF